MFVVIKGRDTPAKINISLFFLLQSGILHMCSYMLTVADLKQSLTVIGTFEKDGAHFLENN